jgi:hypothetical protein
MKTDKEFISCVYDKIAERNNSGYIAIKHQSVAGKLGTAAAAVFIICMVIILPELLNPALKNGALSDVTGLAANDPDITETAEVSVTGDNDLYETSETSGSCGSLLSVSLPLDSYTPTMSSVPGLPFTLKYNGTGKIRYTVTTSAGTLLTWDETDGTVDVYAGSGEYGGEMTLYWSPLITDGNIISAKEVDGTCAVISVSAYTEDDAESKCKITVKCSDIYYTAVSEADIYYFAETKNP